MKYCMNVTYDGHMDLIIGGRWEFTAHRDGKHSRNVFSLIQMPQFTTHLFHRHSLRAKTTTHIRKHFQICASIQYMQPNHQPYQQTLNTSPSVLTCGMVSLLKVKVMLAQSLSGWQRALTAGRWADQHSPWEEQGFTKHCSSRTGTHSWPRGQSPRPEPSIRQGLGPHHSCQREEASQLRNNYTSLLTSVHDLTTSTTHRLSWRTFVQLTIPLWQ